MVALFGLITLTLEHTSFKSLLKNLLLQSCLSVNTPFLSDFGLSILYLFLTRLMWCPLTILYIAFISLLSTYLSCFLVFTVCYPMSFDALFLLSSTDFVSSIYLFICIAFLGRNLPVLSLLLLLPVLLMVAFCLLHFTLPRFNFTLD